MFQNLGNLASLIQQAQQAGSQMEEVQQRLKSERVTGTAGAGMIEIEANGLGEVVKVHIDPTLMQKGDAEMIEDLLPAAINQTQAKAKQLHMDAVKSLTDGLNLPGLNEALARFTGNNTPGA
ncbi:MAG: YbaB/EbfC family nucleoid-associated protein [Planctomycetaceae bacterium]|nr:YbaB/EbfC family nucleoid-associated protein [Planctomycetaceae bacterium]